MTKYFRWDMIVLRSLLLTRRDKGIYAQTWRYPPGSVTYKLYMSYNMFSIIIGHIIHDQQQLHCIDSKCFFEQHRLTSTPWIYGGTYLNLHLRRCLTSYCTLCKKILIIKRKRKKSHVTGLEPIPKSTIKGSYTLPPGGITRGLLPHKIESYVNI